MFLNPSEVRYSLSSCCDKSRNENPPSGVISAGCGFGGVGVSLTPNPSRLPNLIIPISATGRIILIWLFVDCCSIFFLLL